MKVICVPLCDCYNAGGMHFNGVAWTLTSSQRANVPVGRRGLPALVLVQPGY